jgi:adenylate cyclase
MLAYWAGNLQVSGLLLDENQKRLVLRMTPGRFDNQRSNWAATLAGIALSLGDAATARAYADSALPDYETRIRKNPREPANHINLALMLAILGQRAEAVREAEEGVALLREGDLFAGVNLRHSAVQALLLAGNHQKALDQLENLTRSPYYLTPAWLRIDPTFDPIRQHPRFLKLLAAR